MDRREKELEQEIKKLAAKGHNDAARHLAKQLVQLRNQKTKSIGMSARISGVQAQNSYVFLMEILEKKEKISIWNNFNKTTFFLE